MANWLFVIGVVCICSGYYHGVRYTKSIAEDLAVLEQRIITLDKLVEMQQQEIKERDDEIQEALKDLDEARFTLFRMRTEHERDIFKGNGY